LLPHYGVSSESIFGAEVWCQQRISFRCWIVVSAANQFSLPNPVLQRISLLTCLCHQRTNFTDNSVFQRISSLTNLQHQWTSFGDEVLRQIT
jgi:hypothetical protein